MEFSVPIFFIVLSLGIVQLAVGVIFGRCLPLRRTGSPRDAKKLRCFASRLYGLVSSVADDVDRIVAVDVPSASGCDDDRLRSIDDEIVNGIDVKRR